MCRRYTLPYVTLCYRVREQASGCSAAWKLCFPGLTSGCQQLSDMSTLTAWRLFPAPSTSLSSERVQPHHDRVKNSSPLTKENGPIFISLTLASDRDHHPGFLSKLRTIWRRTISSKEAPWQTPDLVRLILHVQRLAKGVGGVAGDPRRALLLSSSWGGTPVVHEHWPWRHLS